MSNAKATKKRQQPKPQRHRGTKSTENRLFLGGSAQPPQDPPMVAYQPWNHLTLAWISKPGDTNFGDLVNKIKAQLDPKGSGLAQSPAVQMKIHSVKVWNLTDKTIALTVYDFHDLDDSDQLCGMMDAGSTGAPRLGYQLPLSHRSTVIRNDDKTGKKKLFTTSAASSSSIMNYVRLEWRFDGPVKGPTVELDHTRQIHEDVKSQNDNFGKVIEKLTELIKAQPSLVTRFIDHAVTAAAEVAVVGADFEDLSLSIRSLKEAIEQQKQ